MEANKILLSIIRGFYVIIYQSVGKTDGLCILESINKRSMIEVVTAKEYEDMR